MSLALRPMSFVGARWRGFLGVAPLLLLSVLLWKGLWAQKSVEFVKYCGTDMRITNAYVSLLVYFLDSELTEVYFLDTSQPASNTRVALRLYPAVPHPNTHPCAHSVYGRKKQGSFWP